MTIYSKEPLVTDEEKLKKFRNLKLKDLKISSRLMNIFKKYEYKITTVEDLLKLSDFQIVDMKGMGEMCFFELKNKLISINALPFRFKK